MERTKIRVRIGGVEYTLLSTEQPDYVYKIAYLVDKKMTEIMNENSNLNSAMASLLTAINIADEYYKDKGDSDKLREQVAEYSRLADEYNNKYVIAEAELKEAQEKIEMLEKALKKVDDNNEFYM